MKKFLALFGLSVAMLVSAAQAQTMVLSNDFATGYTNGDLVGPLNSPAGTVGQNGWTQTGNFTAGNPLTISNGQAVLPSGSTGQDAWKAFSSSVSTTANVGGYLQTSINFTLTNATALATGDYFFHLSSPTNTTQNFYQRLMSRSNSTGFQLGLVTISGTGGATNYGTTVLSLNTLYTAVITWNFVSGAANDVLSLYVNPTDPIITNNTVYTSVTWGSAAEPTTLEAANLRIGSATTTPGVLVNSIDVQVVPEPSIYAMLALSGAGFAGYMIRRRRR